MTPPASTLTAAPPAAETANRAYLGGPVTGLTAAAAAARRRLPLPPGWRGLDPMRSSDHLAGADGALAPRGFPGEQFVFGRCLNDIDRAHVCLMDFRGAAQVSIGSLCELGYAYKAGKPLIVVMEDGNPHDHLFVRQMAMYVTAEMTDALGRLGELAGPPTWGFPPPAPAAPLTDDRHLYLAGPIVGLTYEQAMARRDLPLPAGWSPLDPMRGKQYLQGGGELPAVGYADDRWILLRDLYDIDRADAVLAYLPGVQRVGIGTMCELGYAYRAGKPIITVLDEGSVHDHLFVHEMSSVVCADADDALAKLAELS